MLSLLMDALHRECRLESSDCELEVRDQIAYVRGNVVDLAQKRAIARACKSVPGLRAIVNNLRVTPRLPRSDQRIASDVRTALADTGPTSPIPDVTVIDGVVYLSGTVGPIEAAKTAEDAAWSVPGVEQVVSNIAITALFPRTDQDILKDVETALSRYLGLGSKIVRAEVHSGIVYLTGQVESEYQKALSEDAAAWTPWVVDIVNELLVTSRPPN